MSWPAIRSTGAPCPRLATRLEHADTVADRILGGPFTAALTTWNVLLFAVWLPQYLTWPWWTDLDHFATFAMAWDRGVLPYRDLPSYQFPGEYYLYWFIGKAFGWGRTAPLFAVDAALLAGFGVALAAWSRRRFGRALPGVAAFTLFLGYYLDLGYDLAAQRDWHATLSAALGIFALEAIPGRRGRLLSALGLAIALSIRPHVIVLFPAYLLAIDESARPSDGDWSLTRRAVLEWAAMLAGFLVIAFAPLIAAGIVDDFVRGLREAAPGGKYNRLTGAVLLSRMVDQLTAHTVLLCVAIALMVLSIPARASHKTLPLTKGELEGVPRRAARPCSEPPSIPPPRGGTAEMLGAQSRTAATWLVAMLGAWFYKPLSPIAHQYLTHHLTLIGSVVVALLIARVMVMEMPRGSSTLRLVAILLIIHLTLPAYPRFADIDRSLDVLTQEESWELPRRAPDLGRSSRYAWSDYRDTIVYLRNHVPPGDRIANALRGLSALNGPTARLPAIPEVSLSWFEAVKDRPELEAMYIQTLQQTPRSVVVWSPGEEDAKSSFLPKRLIAYIRRAYRVQARFGSIEIWARRSS